MQHFKCHIYAHTHIKIYTHTYIVTVCVYACKCTTFDWVVHSSNTSHERTQPVENKKLISAAAAPPAPGVPTGAGSGAEAGLPQHPLLCSRSSGAPGSQGGAPARRYMVTPGMKWPLPPYHLGGSSNTRASASPLQGTPRYLRFLRGALRSIFFSLQRGRALLDPFLCTSRLPGCAAPGWPTRRHPPRGLPALHRAAWPPWHQATGTKQRPPELCLLAPYLQKARS